MLKHFGVLFWNGLFCVLAEEFLDQLEHNGGQQEHTNQVGDGHETVEGIGNTPDEAQVQGCTQNSNQRIGNIEAKDDLAAEKELCAASTVQTPADDGGEREAAHSDCGKDGYPIAVDRSKAGDGQFCACCAAIVDGNSADQDDQCGHGADHNGVGEYFENAVQTLLYRLVGVSTGMGDGTGTEACFVGEDAAGDTVLHT